MKLLYPREMLQKLLSKRPVLLPSARDTLFALVDTVFFTSLMIEEGEAVRVAIVHDEGGAAALSKVEDSEWIGEEPAQLAWDVTEIPRRPFDTRTLAKLSRGLQYGTHLAVIGGRAPDLWIDGIARRAPRTDGGSVTRIAAPRPGVIVFEERDRELLRFDAGQEVPPTIDVLSSGCPVRKAIGAITGEIGGDAGYSPPEWALTRLLRQVRATGHGGIVALLPRTPAESELRDVAYRRVDEGILSRKIQMDWAKQKAWFNRLIATSEKVLSPEEVSSMIAVRADHEAAREALDAAISDLAQLSAIDGAVLAGPGFSVYGAGYLIPLSEGFERVMAIDAEMTKVVPLPRRHGARHQAAFSFAHHNPGGVAFVVSEDGPVSCALRIEDRVVTWPVQVSET